MTTNEPESPDTTPAKPVAPMSPTSTRAETGGSPQSASFAAPAAGEQEEAERLTTSELVNRLRDVLGAKLVAYLGSVQETRSVRQWVDAADWRTPPDEVVNRLRMTYRIAALLLEKDSAAVIQAWFRGRNPLLGDVAPARLLRECNLDTAGPSVLAAARAFAAER